MSSRKKLPNSTLGARAELLVAAHLLGLGYNVFRNVAACGPVDIVAIFGSQVIEIDCKSGRSAAWRPCRAKYRAIVDGMGNIRFVPELPSKKPKKK